MIDVAEAFDAKRNYDWVWIYITDDWIDGPIPAYKKDPEG